MPAAPPWLATPLDRREVHARNLLPLQRVSRAVRVYMFLLLSPAFAVDATVWAELARVQKLEAHFEQVQTRKVLKQPLTSHGTVSYDRPKSALLWQVTDPAKSTFSLIGAVAKMDYPDLGMSDTIDLAQVPDANRIASSMLVWMKADASAVSRDFDVTYSAEAAALKPKDKTLAGLLAEIRIQFTPGPWRVRGVDLVEPDGDLVHIVFSGVKLDGVAVVDPK